MNQSTGLVPATLGPGMVPIGFAEQVLERAAAIDDPAILWDSATTCAALAQKWNGHGQEKNEIKSAQMYCEIELGQRLGPPMRHGGDRRSEEFDDQFACELIAPPRAAEFRRYYGLRDELVAAVREGKRSRRSLDVARRSRPTDSSTAVRSLNRRPNRSAAMPVEPEPAKGSMIRSPGAVSAEMIGASSLHYMDIDAALWKKATRRLVIVEHKYPGQFLRPSQLCMLPVLGQIVNLARRKGLINSGLVGALFGAPPFDTATFRPWPSAIDIDLDQRRVDQLLQCQHVDGIDDLTPQEEELR